MTLFSVSYVILWVLLVLQMAALYVLARQVALLAHRLPPRGARITNIGPVVGTRAPEIRERSLQGGEVTIPNPSKASLLVFVTAGCSSCEAIAPALRSLARQERKVLDLILVTGSSNELETKRFLKRHRLDHVPIVASDDVLERYEIGGSPYGVVVDVNGNVVSKGIVNHREHLDSLVNALETGHASLESFNDNAFVSPEWVAALSKQGPRGSDSGVQ